MGVVLLLSVGVTTILPFDKPVEMTVVIASLPLPLPLPFDLDLDLELELTLVLALLGFFCGSMSLPYARQSICLEISSVIIDCISTTLSVTSSHINKLSNSNSPTRLYSVFRCIILIEANLMPHLFITQYCSAASRICCGLTELVPFTSYA